MAGKIIAILLLLIMLGASLYFLYHIYQNFYSEPKNIDVKYVKYSPDIISDHLQFYPNMRFNHNPISYRIAEECDAQKRIDMLWAFSYLENRTEILKFYEAGENEDIIVRCGEEYKKGDMFVAGEGGPDSMINTTLFSVIFKGRILFLASNQCSGNVALHELLHVFGFEHSDDKRSIMYNVSFCEQELSNQIVNEIKRLYAIEPLPDLYFDSINGTKQGSYLNIDFSVKNQGLLDSENISVILYSGEELEKFDLGKIEVGAGKILSVQNIKVKSSDKSFKLLISNGKELNEENNKAILNLIAG